MDNTKEYILCSAIKRKKNRTCEPYYRNKNDICNVELGYRHHDILIRYKGIVQTNILAQGFYTSKGRFVDRVEAAKIAKNAGQVKECVDRLYSEDLY